MRMSRTWDSTLSMIPKGGDTVWGGLDWSPEEGYVQFVSSSLKDPCLEFELLHHVLFKRHVIPSFGVKAITLEEEGLVPSALLLEDIYVARAPARLDVIGGIPDYSGSLVLQMPIREACHVVSYGSELSNHTPTFDMDMSDFMDGDQPISYEKARSCFARDPSQKYYFSLYASHCMT
ncbi:L-arabinokinase-like protein [Tanacetum coccineum]